MSIRYSILFQGGEDEIEEKKSRFIAQTFPVTSEEEALSFIGQVKKKHYDARHNCYAYVIGKNHEVQRFSDDGEPSGTAGKPILEILLKEDIHNGLIVVTRYFGGTLLGTGGLIRAYGRGAKAGIKASEIAEVRQGGLFQIGVAYTDLGKIEYFIRQEEILIMEQRYEEEVQIVLLLEEAQIEKVNEALIDGSGGRVKITKEKDVSFIVVNGKGIIID
ncbi:putative YigZ family protein [Aequitasia blattaphilus]|uniref:YigZ family protein n=1 Tax=Aequitasia blattaphilus TaxID=2949332 RepID=A0ABT1E8X7_9FIRM|nr:YigZ family protein [Aequitasia blattaphilus]MCP1101447.1 YigZ family protein [Aequitasia blattaphilus]MCR8614087.1 YigZ family protein [Aequitasia blattaphilus]